MDKGGIVETRTKHVAPVVDGWMDELSLTSTLIAVALPSLCFL